MAQGNLAIKKLKIVEARLKNLEDRLKDLSDITDETERTNELARINLKFQQEGKAWLLGRKGDKHTGDDIGRTILKLREQKKLIEKLLGTETIGKNKGALTTNIGAIPDFLKADFDKAKREYLREVGAKKTPLMIYNPLVPADMRKGAPKIGLTIGGKGKFINPYYVRQYNPRIQKKEAKEYETAQSDYLRGTDITGMSEDAIDKGVRSNLTRDHSLYYDPTGEKKTLNPILKFNDSGVSRTDTKHTSYIGKTTSNENDGRAITNTLVGSLAPWRGRGSGRTRDEAVASSDSWLKDRLSIKDYQKISSRHDYDEVLEDLRIRQPHVVNNRLQINTGRHESYQMR